jgi:vacuolar-type H+-ATPase subunit H
LEKIDNVESDVKARLEKADLDAEKILVKAREKASEIEKSSANLAKKSKEKVIAEAEMQADSIIS